MHKEKCTFYSLIIQSLFNLQTVLLPLMPYVYTGKNPKLLYSWLPLKTDQPY